MTREDSEETVFGMITELSESLLHRSIGLGCLNDLFWSDNGDFVAVQFLAEVDGTDTLELI